MGLQSYDKVSSNLPRLWEVKFCDVSVDHSSYFSQNNEEEYNVDLTSPETDKNQYQKLIDT